MKASTFLSATADPVKGPVRARARSTRVPSRSTMLKAARQKSLHAACQTAYGLPNLPLYVRRLVEDFEHYEIPVPGKFMLKIKRMAYRNADIITKLPASRALPTITCPECGNKLELHPTMMCSACGAVVTHSSALKGYSLYVVPKEVEA